MGKYEKLEWGFLCWCFKIEKQVIIVYISVDAHDLMDKLCRTIGQQSDINLLPIICPESIFVKKVYGLTWDLSNIFSSKESMVLPSTFPAGDTL